MGRQLSLAYARAGCQNVTVVDLNSDNLAETVRLLQTEFPKVGVLPLVVNVANESAVNEMVEKAVREFGTLDYAANAASIICKARDKTAFMPSDEYDRTMNVNARAVALCNEDGRVMRGGA
ncbi:hypothetical protein EK21DRAFT_119777 [Setomelanomma holmii]|uniref:Uncharacterized protein n=1 Tax=Setomelanomma holmii TaxID=210430 RepID=A0A9P4GVV2_9PLEO|nr:hypothetical protein EK21DRAFT_119777 [Setomelanomma holmii]